jgi:mycothiol synthase
VPLFIRPYVRGQDDELWVGIHNTAWQEDEDFVPDTVEHLERWQDTPWTGVRVRLLAEVDGIPAARIEAETDKTITEPKGFVDGPDVVPEQRRKGIGTALMKQTLESLRAAGMQTVESGGFDNAARNGFLSSLGFSVVRRFCRMRRTLAQVPASIGEARDATVELLGRTDADLAIVSHLHNEAFREHYNYTPGTLDELRFVTKNVDEDGDIMYLTVARVGGEPAGFLMYGIDPRENEHLNKRRGGLWNIGVVKPYRGRGVAKRLMIDAMDHLRREGMDEVDLNVDETNVTGALHLYERLGFAVTRRRLTYTRALAGSGDV